jgi:hypothetical protein
MIALLFLAPLFLLFELWQLVVCERYMGIKQLAAGIDPRRLPMREGLALGWIAVLVVYWVWTGLILGLPFARVPALCLFSVSLAGYGLRRNSPLKWALVILTFEGAVRIGMLVSLCGTLGRRLAAGW